MVAWVLRFALFGFGNPTDGLWMIILSCIVYGMAFDFFNISGSLFVETTTDDKIRSSAQGLFMMMTNGFGALLGAKISGVLIDQYFTHNGVKDWPNIWISFAAYALVVAILFYFLFNHKHDPKAVEQGLMVPPAPPPSDYINVAFEEISIPELKKYQEDQVKKALEASKKILEKAEWEKVESNIAEALSMKEKEELKASYFKELEKFDWKQWENKLKIAYNNIDWDRVNSELNMAINQIRADSLHRVYNEAAVKLDKVKRQLQENQLKGIPDSDISIEAIEEKKQVIRKTLDELKGIRKKKIVRL